MAATSPFSISMARSASDVSAVATLFRAYASSLDVDLAYQNFEAELTGLPGRYAAPSGALLLARAGDGAAVGCVALRAMEREGAVEMKRLFVAPAGRGSGLGRILVAAAIDEARRLGYRDLCLDTLPSMTAAIALYRASGFVPMAPYYDTPISGTHFMRRPLDD